MTRDEVILTAFAPAKGTAHSPVQVQKLLFLVDKRASDAIGGAKFEFAAYDYGPFDRSIYDDLMRLCREGIVEILGDPSAKGRKYKLTEKGQLMAEEILAQQQPAVRDYFGQLSHWVRSQTFAQLVSAIYEAYPEMKANSVFAG